ncbi:MAG: glycosyltransferase family 2 protein [Bacteroidota bacterium]|nr:glycosyltransferase family 2 protein [Bacteroidota bacterium]
MHPISAVIITKNEEKIIGKTLAAVKSIADEIIIVDNYSTDETIEICRAFGAKIFLSEWKGFGPQKNFGIQQSSYKYILALDADEVLTPEAIREIKELKTNGLAGVYEFPLLNFYFGKFLKHGLEYPNLKRRLFDKTIVQWNDNAVHEALIIPDGYPTITLNGHIEHYSFSTIKHYINKANAYTTIGAADLKGRGKKNYLIKMIFSPSFVFFKSYFLNAGFLDGTHGFVTAYFNAYTNFLKYAKLWELYRNEKHAA